MRVVYRVIAVAASVLIVAAAGTVFALTGGFDRLSGGSAPAAAPPEPGAATGPAGTGDASPAPVVPTGATASGAVPPSVGITATSAATPPGSPGPTAATPAVPDAVRTGGSPAVPAQATASPLPGGGQGVLAAVAADPRVSGLPEDGRLTNYPGKGGRTKGRVKDSRSGVSFARFTKSWRLVSSAPFATRRLLPAVKGARHRGLLATCPVPIAVQEELRDTAVLAARWSLKHHPDGSTITWTASQPFKAGKRDGWLLGYRVHYEARGEKHVATAAVALVDVRRAKPAMVLITIPDAQKKRWADINTLMSGLRAL
ncbi:hypothetical protein Sru01_60130 [Sphaerisporangium rufum]|uniref:Uncharacterized protein n=1 Tax=Sphaerisporangium rufum TaxID=1381558 RepID=A0A919R9R5_9ACTN|nr:hypothetical protein [Sphaerisporangium rufum]GII81031.1 hypothetical protein Sru01_60130 [Sphaerisporangium rufum]